MVTNANGEILQGWNELEFKHTVDFELYDDGWRVVENPNEYGYDKLFSLEKISANKFDFLVQSN